MQFELPEMSSSYFKQNLTALLLYPFVQIVPYRTTKRKKEKNKTKTKLFPFYILTLLLTQECILFPHIVPKDNLLCMCISFSMPLKSDIQNHTQNCVM